MVPRAGDVVKFSIYALDGVFTGQGRLMEDFAGDQAPVELKEVVWDVVENGGMDVVDVHDELDVDWEDGQAFILWEDIEEGDE